jgi:Skp family chaperone for outer membrane proteins
MDAIKKTGRQLLLLVLACGVAMTASWLYVRHSNKKIAVVDAIKLFNEFKMKQELEAKSAGVLQALSHYADSLQQEFTMKTRLKAAPQEEMNALAAAFRQAQARLEQQYEQSNQEINQQVWKRLNPLVDAYGKDGGFRLIIGANGMGSVLYNDDYYDRTSEVIRYVNEHYEKGN